MFVRVVGSVHFSRSRLTTVDMFQGVVFVVYRSMYLSTTTNSWVHSEAFFSKYYIGTAVIMNIARSLHYIHNIKAMGIQISKCPRMSWLRSVYNVSKQYIVSCKYSSVWYCFPA